jgi:hypothetical protein
MGIFRLVGFSPCDDTENNAAAENEVDYNRKVDFVDEKPSLMLTVSREVVSGKGRKRVGMHGLTSCSRNPELKE